MSIRPVVKQYGRQLCEVQVLTLIFGDVMVSIAYYDSVSDVELGKRI